MEHSQHSYKGGSFKLWLETDAIVLNEHELCESGMNIHVYLDDGRMLGINVWTFGVLKRSIQEDERSGAVQLKLPDMVVKSLHRDAIVRAVTESLNGWRDEFIQKNLVPTGGAFA